MTQSCANPWCVNTAVRSIQGGCEHEHIAVRQVCEHHAEMALSGLADCRACYNIDGHRCKIRAREVVA